MNLQLKTYQSPHPETTFSARLCDGSHMGYFNA